MLKVFLSLYFLTLFLSRMKEYDDKPLGRSKWAWIRWFGFDQFVPERAVTSYWLPHQVLLVIRVLFMLYSTATMYASIAQSALNHDFNIYFGYFTHLTFVGLHAYFVVGSVRSFSSGTQNL